MKIIKKKSKYAFYSDKGETIEDICQLNRIMWNRLVLDLLSKEEKSLTKEAKCGKILSIDRRFYVAM